MAQISLDIDDEIKRSAERTFELSTDPFYSKENIEKLEKRVADIRSGKSILKEHELIKVE